MKFLLSRIGAFLILIGVAIFFLFVLSELAGMPDFDYLFLALLVLGGGYLLRGKPERPASSGRFSILRRGRTARSVAEPTEGPQEDDEVD